MNMLFLVPVALLVLFVLIALSWRKSRGGSGMGDRSDANERPELRGETQWKGRGTRPTP